MAKSYNSMIKEALNLYEKEVQMNPMALEMKEVR
jgi:hypothetical protein